MSQPYTVRYRPVDLSVGYLQPHEVIDPHCQRVHLPCQPAPLINEDLGEHVGVHGLDTSATSTLDGQERAVEVSRQRFECHDQGP
jgi:hypothetical protein